MSGSKESLANICCVPTVAAYNSNIAYVALQRYALGGYYAMPLPDPSKRIYESLEVSVPDMIQDSLSVEFSDEDGSETAHIIFSNRLKTQKKRELLAELKERVQIDKHPAPMAVFFSIQGDWMETQQVALILNGIFPSLFCLPRPLVAAYHCLSAARQPKNASALEYLLGIDGELWRLKYSFSQSRISTGSIEEIWSAIDLRRLPSAAGAEVNDEDFQTIQKSFYFPAGSPEHFEKRMEALLDKKAPVCKKRFRCDPHFEFNALSYLQFVVNVNASGLLQEKGESAAVVTQAVFSRNVDMKFTRALQQIKDNCGRSVPEAWAWYERAFRETLFPE